VEKKQTRNVRRISAPRQTYTHTIAIAKTKRAPATGNGLGSRHQPSALPIVQQDACCRIGCAWEQQHQRQHQQEQHQQEQHQRQLVLSIHKVSSLRTQAAVCVCVCVNVWQESWHPCSRTCRQRRLLCSPLFVYLCAFFLLAFFLHFSVCVCVLSFLPPESICLALATTTTATAAG